MTSEFLTGKERLCHIPLFGSLYTVFRVLSLLCMYVHYSTFIVYQYSMCMM